MIISWDFMEMEVFVAFAAGCMYDGNSGGGNEPAAE